jgi:cytoskeletal protein CcmA (bactofilin family)
LLRAGHVCGGFRNVSGNNLLNLAAITGKVEGMTDVHNDALEDEDFDTILSSDIEFSGTLRFDKPFLIRGRLSGEIIARSLLVVDEAAVVEANISASRVIVRGSVKGNVNATEKVEVAITGRLVGNVSAPEIFMETGCVFNGRCTMTEKKVSE